MDPMVRAEDETKDQFSRRIKLSAKGYKSHLTLKIAAQENLYNFFAASPSAYGVQALQDGIKDIKKACLLYTSPSPRDKRQSRMPSSA